MEWNSNQDDERESNESKPILLVPAHISIPGSFLCPTIYHMISHQPWKHHLPVGAGDRIHDLSLCWDLLPVTDHVIGPKTRSYLPDRSLWKLPETLLLLALLNVAQAKLLRTLERFEMIQGHMVPDFKARVLKIYRKCFDKLELLNLIFVLIIKNFL